MRRQLVVAFVLALSPAAWAQREEKTNSLEYHGIRANAQTRPEDHTMNRNPGKPGWGGCVPSSVRTAALYHGIDPAKVDAFWELAQREVGVGGTDPNLLASMLSRSMPDEKWISYYGDDQAVADKLSSKGYLVCGTMAWGDLYGGQRIAHMVNYPHISEADGLACVEDNNDPPGVYRWMTHNEAIARIFAGGQGWLFAFTRSPAAARLLVGVLASAVLLALAALVVSTAFAARRLFAT